MSPTQRTLAELRRQGYTAAVTEHWNSFAKIRQDLFGFIDVVAVKSTEPGVLAIQCTSMANVIPRVNKIAEIAVAGVWLAAQNRLEVWGWRKGGPRGKVKHWDFARRIITANEIVQ